MRGYKATPNSNPTSRRPQKVTPDNSEECFPQQVTPNNSEENLPSNVNSSTALAGCAAAASHLEQEQAEPSLAIPATLEQELKYHPYGCSPLFSNPIKNSNRKEESLRKLLLAGEKSSLNNYRVSSHYIRKIQPKRRQIKEDEELFNDLLEEANNLDKEMVVRRKCIKELRLKPKLYSEKPLGKANVELLSSTSARNISLANNSYNDNHNENNPESDQWNHQLLKWSPLRINRFWNSDLEMNPVEEESQKDSFRDLNRDAYEEPSAIHKCGIVLKRPGYYVLPPIEILDGLVNEGGNCFVQNFTVGRENYGNVCFPGFTNVAGLNLDEIVFIRRKAVVIYVNDEEKPPLGEGLNKMARVTLDQVWPKDKISHTVIKSTEQLKAINYEAKLKSVTTYIGANFIEYRSETGSWVFQVYHF